MPSVNDEQATTYHRDGSILVKAMFDREEIELLGQAAKEDRELDRRSRDRADGEGGSVRLSLWNHPGNGIYGMVARSARIVESMEKLLEGEVYHYHSKMILKDPEIGGAWTWHQDYGYWYQNGLLFPDLASVMIAVDDATRENGCLQVLRGSHKMGRLNHILTGDQAGADKEHVEQALKRLELVHCEMKAGDALYLHSNTLHCSAANLSEHARWALICCYNTRTNDPYKESHHPGYTPLEKVDDDMVLKVGRDDAKRSSVEFANLVEEDKSAKSLAETEG